MNKEHLKNYLSEYGEIEFLKDLASIFSDLSQEWTPANSEIAKKFATANLMVASAAVALDNDDREYQGLETKAIGVEVLTTEEAIKEYAQLQEFFANQSFKDFKSYYKDHHEEFLKKLNRMKVLQDAIAQVTNK